MYATEGSTIEQVKDWLDECQFTSKIGLTVQNYVDEMPMKFFAESFLSPEDVKEYTKLWDPEKGRRVPFMTFDKLVTVIK